MTFVSYAQNFEDVMLHRALAHVKQGFFIDVGAQHPSDDSVTKAFSLRGWRGINIEPVPHWYNLLVEDRPYDINLNIAVGDGDGLTIFEVEETGWSTGDRALAERYREEGKVVHEHHVPATTLDRILEQQHVDVVHFLKVDCEGAERVALESCSFDSVRPWIVVVEATEPNSQIPSHESWEPILLGHGYLFAYFDGLNRYYVAREHEELLAAFSAPPNVFDNFIRARHKLAHDERHHLKHEVGTLRTDLVQSRSVIAHLSDSLDATHRDHAERIAAARTVAQEAEERRGQLEVEVEGIRRGLEQEVTRRDQIIGALVTSVSWRITAPLRGLKSVVKGVLRRGWRLARPVVAQGARAARPAMHTALALPGVRPVVRKVFGPQTRLGSRARRFLFPHAAGDGSAPLGPVVLNERAQAMDALLRAAIAKRSGRQA
jgi:FkbM family methyltransferase